MVRLGMVFINMLVQSANIYSRESAVITFKVISNSMYIHIMLFQFLYIHHFKITVSTFNLASLYMTFFHVFIQGCRVN